MMVQKLYKQRSTIVMSIPKLLCKKLGVCAGDYITLSECPGFLDNNMVCMKKLEVQNVRHKTGKGERHKGGKI